MEVKFHSAAKRELRDATAYLERERSGLGEEFAAVVAAGIAQIARQPHILRVLFNHVRRLNLPRFQHAIIYQHKPESDVVRVIAIMHVRRRPMYWRWRV